ncbi:MAG: GNAT family N-acetyltransferase [Anaerolineae bacterium]|nr:GNAT family N-acetyltransferase [Anaerolineae bacterium]
MYICDLRPDAEAVIVQAAQLLVAGFRQHWPNAWPTLGAALDEVRECLSAERICRAAIVQETVLGWIGGIPQYDGHVWELHPLVVRADARGRGIGRALVEDLELQVAARGGLTIYLGTDDEDDMTSLSGVDLYDNLWERIAHIQNLKGHPYSFYARLGYSIVGVVPDANGLGKPDICMAKRVQQSR